MVLTQLRAGQIWVGRGIAIRVTRVGMGVAWVDLIHIALRDGYRSHPWSLLSMEGMKLVIR
jgi:hypothetical protein